MRTRAHRERDASRANLFHLGGVARASDPNFAKSVAQRRGELLLAEIAARVHRGEEEEIGVRPELLHLGSALLG